MYLFLNNLPLIKDPKVKAYSKYQKPDCYEADFPNPPYFRTF